MKRKAPRSAMPANLTTYDPAEWMDAPLTEDERQSFGSAADMADIAFSRWLRARWEHAEAAGMPGRSSTSWSTSRGRQAAC